ncbi:hypothetical protein RKD41_007232 [Streptomyces tendae]
MGPSNSYPTITYPGARDRALLADFLNRCTRVLAAQYGAEAVVSWPLRAPNKSGARLAASGPHARRVAESPW